MYDPDRFDAEIILDRSGFSAPFTTEVLCAILNRSHNTLADARRRGLIPQPEFPGSAPERRPSVWSKEQVIDILVSDYYLRPPSPIDHGTYRGFCTERRRGIPHCELCKEANRAKTREYRAGRPSRGAGPFIQRGPRKVSA